MASNKYVFGESRPEDGGQDDAVFIRVDEPPITLSIEAAPKPRTATQLKKLLEALTREENGETPLKEFTELTLIQPFLAYGYQVCFIESADRDEDEVLDQPPKPARIGSKTIEPAMPMENKSVYTPFPPTMAGAQPRPQPEDAAAVAAVSRITHDDEMKALKELLRLKDDPYPAPPDPANAPDAAAAAVRDGEPDAEPPRPDPQPPAAHSIPVILFNVLVALEWTPTKTYLRQLRWAFKRASDYLYDATDGRMAFGHVTFLDSRFMEACDIQIMASNRFHPRSWVAAFHRDDKYLPIRVGRGTWHPGNQISVDWDEPESYRPLVHEWGHYALGLKDEYLEPRIVAAVNQSVPGAYPQTLSAYPCYTLVVPKTSLSSRSIMAITVGASELSVRPPGDRSRERQQQWTKIKEYFRGVDQPAPQEGPRQLPLPLPTFRAIFEQAPTEPYKLPPLQWTAAAARLPLKPPAGVDLGQCWVYVVRNLKEAPELIPQGTLTARSMHEPMELLGAQKGDEVILIVGRFPNAEVWCSPIEAATYAGDWKLRAISSAANAQIVVQPQRELLTTQRHREALIEVVITGKRPSQVWLFALGMPKAIPLSLIGDSIWRVACDQRSTLDGYIMASWDDCSIMIVPFSQGGGPPSNGAFAPVPITAGSSDGGVMVFFHDAQAAMDEQYGRQNDLARQKIDEERSQVKVITTINNGVYANHPHIQATPHSYSFSVSSNNPLPAECSPTLVVRYDPLSELEALNGQLLICRLEGDAWVPQPTYLPVGAPFVAMPLTRATGAKLFDTNGGSEHYQVFWLPRTPVQPCVNVLIAAC